MSDEGINAQMIEIRADIPANVQGTTGGGERPGVLGRLQAKWQMMYNMMKGNGLVGWSLALVFAVLFIIFAALYGSASQPPALTLPPALTESMSLEQQYQQQQLVLPRCVPGMVVIDVRDYLKALNPNDEVLDGLLTRYTPAFRCRGLCDDGSFCNPSEVEHRDIVVQYMADNGTIMYATRTVQDYTKCSCDVL